MIKMIVTDLDDTLLRTDKTISAYTKEILAKVREKGVKTVFATARGGRSAKELVPYELFDAHILMNGANASIGGAQVYAKTITPAVMRPFLQKLTALGIDAAAEIGGMHYTNFSIRKRWGYIYDYEVTDFSSLPGNADKLYAVIEKPGQAEKIAAALPGGLYLHVSRDNLAMVMHEEATKMNAVEAVAEKWGIAVGDVAAFGDDINDKEMLSKCGVGVAMGNALEEVKKVADCICDTSDNDGVAKWLAERVL